MRVVVLPGAEQRFDSCASPPGNGQAKQTRHKRRIQKDTAPVCRESGIELLLVLVDLAKKIVGIDQQWVVLKCLRTAGSSGGPCPTVCVLTRLLE
jgi:hypothetical protein